MSSSELRLEDFRIPLDEIKVATDNFNKNYMLGSGRFGTIYKGQLSKRFKISTVAIKRLSPNGYAGKNEFLDKLKLMFRFQHEYIIPFIGYCDEDDHMITVTRYAMNGSLDGFLENSNMRHYLTWAKRLKICIGVARGLQYLHSGIGEDNIVIHRGIKSANIFLHENLEAQIGDFELSVTVPKSQQKVYEPPAGTQVYLDPIYHESGILKAEADVFSLGVVLFEILTGMVAYDYRRIGDDEPQQMIKLVRRYYDVGLDKLIDPDIRDQMMCRSLHAFEELAYKCISLNTKDRPTMDKIIKTLEEALNIFQNRGTASTTTVRANYQYKELGEFLFPLEKIILATENFSSKHEIGDGRFTKVYEGKIFERSAAFKRYNNEGEQEFFNELEMVSSSKHENIIPFIGYCYEVSEMIMIYEYAVNGSLDRHLQDPDRRRHMTWAQRLKICKGVATALSYLHSGLGDEIGKVIHGNIKSGKVLLDDNLEATLSGFGMSVVVPKDQRQVYQLDSVNKGTQFNVDPIYQETDMLQTVNKGTQFYVDPIYQETGMLQTESDMYSFGMVLFEIVSGMLAYHKRSIGDEQPQSLTNLVRRYYDDRPENLIDPFIRDIDPRSFRVFKEIAYKCISFNLEERPSMNKVIKRINEALEIQNQRDASTFTTRSLQSQKRDFQIPLEEIEKAIKEFPKQSVDRGGFGTVYKGKLSERWNNRIAAIKFLNLNGHQGKAAFDNELKLISSFHHENIIDFIGYCDKGNDRILVFEYAINGSLDSHLELPQKDRPITWAERLKICIGAARGLKYLHLGGEDKNTVIHRDVKSGNILLDEKFEAKICDFGLSKSGPDDQPYSKLFTKVAGTQYYMDPSYQEGGILRIESDVYSFGVVMFELLTGIPAWHKRSFGDGDPQLLINLVRRYSLDKLVDPLIKDKSDSDSLRTFTDIAYKCIDLNLDKRPTMERIIDKIEDALELQENYLAKAGVKVINQR